MTRLDPSTEPARETAYQRLHERIKTQDGCISWLLVEVRALQRRVVKLEQHNAHTAANMVRAAYREAQAMTDEERRMFSNRLRERDAEIERLRAALIHISEHGDMPSDQLAMVALRALEPEP